MTIIFFSSTNRASPVFAQVRPVISETRLPTKPVGMNVFKTLVEFENVDAAHPGTTVDVKLATLGEEGAKAARILSGLRIYSTSMPNAAGSPFTEDASADQNKLMPMRVVGLLINGPQLETLRVAQSQGVLRVSVVDPAEHQGVIVR